MVWLLMGYLFLVIYRPFEVWPVLGPLRIELLYMLAAGTVWLVAPNKRLRLNPPVLAVFGMIAAVLLCCLASPWAADCLESMDSWLKLQVFVLMLITVVQNERDLRRLIVTWLAVLALYMLHSLWEFHCGRHVSRMGINRLVGVDSSNGDPNALALTILLSLVFVPVFWRTCGTGLVRLLLGGYAAMGVLCISFTGSRTSFVGLILFLMATAWGSAWRKKFIAVMVILAPLGFLALPEELQNRFETIVNPAAGPANARTSAHGRVEGFEIGMELWQNNPAMGVGPGAWIKATGKKLRAHNLYGQLAGEMGTVGVIAFGGLLLACLVSFRQIRRAYREHPEWDQDFTFHLNSAIGLGFILLLVSGLAGHNLFRPHWVLYAAMLSIMASRVAERVNTTATSWDSEVEAPEEWPEDAAVVPVG